MAIQWGCRGATAVVGHIPSLAALLYDRIRVVSIEWVAAPMNLMTRASSPLLYLYVLCDRGPPTS